MGPKVQPNPCRKKRKEKDPFYTTIGPEDPKTQPFDLDLSKLHENITKGTKTSS